MRLNGEARRPPRLLVADRHPLVAAALATLLRHNGYDIIAQAHSGADAETTLAGGDIDAALLDIDLGAPGPLVLLDLLRGRGQRLPVVVTAPGPDHAALGAVFESSASGVVLKSEDAESLLHCLSAVCAGGQWFDRIATARAIDRVAAQNSAATLTRRERDVAKLVATGRRNRDIAGTLGISEGTVKMHLHNVYAKLGLESRTQLAMDERLRTLG